MVLAIIAACMALVMFMVSILAAIFGSNNDGYSYSFYTVSNAECFTALAELPRAFQAYRTGLVYPCIFEREHWTGDRSDIFQLKFVFSISYPLQLQLLLLLILLLY